MRFTWSRPPVPARVPAEGYAYVCDDRSVLRPWLMRFVVLPLAAATPPWLSPSAITFLAFLLSLSPFVLPGHWLLAAFALPAYVALDHLDGVHARRTGATSVYGDYLDHWLDAWNAGLVPLGIALSWGGGGAWPLLLVVPSCLAFTLTTIEHRETGVLRLEPLGATEAMFASGVAYLLLTSGVGDLAVPVFAICVASTAGATATLLRRARRLPLDLLPLLVSATASAVAVGRGGCAATAALVVTVAAAITCGRLIRARIMGQDVYPDGVAVAAVLVLPVLPQAAGLVALTLLGRAVVDYREMTALCRRQTRA